MTSASTSFPQRLTKVDPLTCGDHHHLREEDNCYFLGEYTARRGFAHSATNNLIINFKKPMDRRGTAQWPYKALNIRTAAEALFNALRTGDLRSYTFVPVPPSKAKTDPQYDDRMLAMLSQLSTLFLQSNGYALDIRELAVQPQSTPAAHDDGPRPSPAQICQGYEVDVRLIAGTRPHILICDDVLTTGSHYVAMCNALSPHLPNASFRGLFLARRAPEAVDFEAIFGEE